MRADVQQRAGPVQGAVEGVLVHQTKMVPAETATTPPPTAARIAARRIPPGAQHQAGGPAHLDALLDLQRQGIAAAALQQQPGQA